MAGNESDFEAFLAPLQPIVKDLDLAAIAPLFKLDSGVFQANWKFICENFVEPYHVPVVHPETAAGQPLHKHYMMGEGHLVGCAIDIDEDSFPLPRFRRDYNTEVEGEIGASCADQSMKSKYWFPSLALVPFCDKSDQLRLYQLDQTKTRLRPTTIGDSLIETKAKRAKLHPRNVFVEL